MIFTYMDMCVSLCMNPLEGLPSLAGMVRGPHKVGLPELKPTGSPLLINQFTLGSHWYFQQGWLQQLLSVTAQWDVWK